MATTIIGFILLYISQEIHTYIQKSHIHWENHRQGYSGWRRITGDAAVQTWEMTLRLEAVAYENPLLMILVHFLCERQVLPERVGIFETVLGLLEYVYLRNTGMFLPFLGDGGGVACWNERTSSMSKERWRKEPFGQRRR